jgi:hypothetical protein
MNTSLPDLRAKSYAINYYYSSKLTLPVGITILKGNLRAKFLVFPGSLKIWKISIDS